MKRTITLLCAMSIATKLVFKIKGLDDGAIEFYPKTKYQRKPVGEDAFCTTKHTLAVADGISQGSFLSQYIASALAFQTTIQFLTHLKHSDDPISIEANSITDDVNSALQIEIEGYNSKLNLNNKLAHQLEKVNL